MASVMLEDICIYQVLGKNVHRRQRNLTKQVSGESSKGWIQDWQQEINGDCITTYLHMFGSGTQGLYVLLRYLTR